MQDEFSLLEAQQLIHELIAQRAPLERTLDAIANWLNMVLPDATVAFMRYEPRRCTLSLLPSHRFSTFYTKRLQDVPVAPGVASFGTAAFERRLVVSENIATDPRWEALREAALAEGLRSCWSSPVMTADGALLGTFGTYYPTPRKPTPEGRRWLQRAAAMIALAMLRDNDIREHRSLSEWHRSLFVNHPDGVYEFDLEGYIQRCNAAFERITGYPEAELIGRHYNELVYPAYRQLTREGFATARRGEAITYETRGTHAGQFVYDLEVTNFPVTIDGEIAGVYGVCRDITERKRQIEDLRLLKRGFDASPNGMLMVDARRPDMPIVFVNPAFTIMTGYPTDEVMGKNCRFLQGPETDPTAIAEIRAGIAEQRDVEVTLRNYRRDGTPFWNHLIVSPVFDEEDRCTHFIGIQQDITRQKEQDAQIAYQATHDLLTGLPNRTSFTNRLEASFHQCQQQQAVMAVMYLDLDGFKPINEGLGHHVGNQVLVAVAQRLKALLGDNDSLSRLVGDEFGILLLDYDNSAVVKALAKRMLDALAQPFEVDGQLVQLSVSIGIACNCLSPEQPHELMQHADLALQQAKRQGRNTWQWYRGRRVESTRHSVLMRHDLHAALKEDQFELHYQPLVDAASGRIRSVEALVRWHHPRRGMVSPGEFIPLAEHTGQIIPLGRWVLRQACQEMAELQARDGRALPVAVNISSLQFHRDGFLDEVRHILATTGLSPELLELEVTESVLLDGAEPVIELMETLKTMGVRVALDDFGTGFSSLSYLRDLPTHKVKLDRSFVQKTLTDRRTAAIVQGVITMAHHMDMVVVAEGIETPEEQEDMVRRECDLLLGFLFARPLPLAALRQLPDCLPEPRS
ncbi:sensor domain-containing phosphodiesterase [Halomonas sp. PBN3]|uniref:sensor domain-containing phosphodiesterase n=1 Tax=Halomonas sp. PBN3 TaxID=1397528 RepID=UPI0003B820C3|nr:EAL domain-containing protein [Halomonas sp. PBN3]ERS91791.1 hypothetical protein Q671_14930 [Halomonas sp. PBN3]